MISFLPPSMTPPPEADDIDPVDAGYALDDAASRVAVRLDTPSPMRLRVLRVGPAGLWVAPPVRGGGPIGAVPLTLDAGAQRVTSLLGHFEPPSPFDAAGVTRVRLPEVSPDQARRILDVVVDLAAEGQLSRASGRAAVTEVVSEPGRVLSLARTLCAYECEGFARGADGTVTAVRGLAPSPGAALPLLWSYDGAVPAAPVTFVVGGLLSVFEMTVDRVEPQAGALATSAPDRIVRTRRRWWRRVGSDAPLVVAFRHPRWPELTVRIPMQDLSREGLGLRAAPRRDLLYPGLDLPSLEVVEGRLAGLRLRGQVRHVGLREEGSAGLRVAAGGEDEERWTEELDRRLYPRTRSRGTWIGHLWDLFTDAGYFALAGKSKAHFAHLRRSYANIVSRLELSPALGCQVVWPSPTGIEAALTALRAWEHTWFIAHLARRKTEAAEAPQGRALLRDVHLHTGELTQLDPSVRWVLAYVQVHQRWPRLPYFAFPQRFVDSGEACVLRFQPLQVGTDPTLRGVVPGVEVAAPTPVEVDALVRRVAETRPVMYAESLDFTPDRIGMTRLQATWRDAGLDRERKLRVARRDGLPVAMAVLEKASDAAHLYGLFDAMRIFPLGEAAPDADAFAALLEDGRTQFRAWGKGFYVYIQEHEDVGERARAGVTDMGAADLTVFSSRLVPDFLEYVWEVTSGNSGT